MVLIIEQKLALPETSYEIRTRARWDLMTAKSFPYIDCTSITDLHIASELVANSPCRMFFFFSSLYFNFPFLIFLANYTRSREYFIIFSSPQHFSAILIANPINFRPYSRFIPASQTLMYYASREVLKIHVKNNLLGQRGLRLFYFRRIPRRHVNPKWVHQNRV